MILEHPSRTLYFEEANNVFSGPKEDGMCPNISMHTEILSAENTLNSFVMFLKNAEDTILDILDASNELAVFLARAVIDDVHASLNLDETHSRLPPYSSGSEIVHMARTLVSACPAGQLLAIQINADGASNAQGCNMMNSWRRHDIFSQRWLELETWHEMEWV
ncbi:hypothetical protein RYX36_025676 [Vicia faba]